MRRIDLTGQRFGKWHVGQFVEGGGRHPKWLCTCDCGREKEVFGSNLRTGISTSCGCRFEDTSEDLKGHRFGRWEAMSPSEDQGRKWWCRCDCGTVWTVKAASLLGGLSHSCGCLNREISLGINIGVVTHDMWKTVENKTWHVMRNRCSNPRNDAYATHGGRGIRVCEEWDTSFAAFLRDVGMRPSSDHRLRRLDTNGDFEPGNCRWVHRSVSFARAPTSQMSSIAR